MLLGLTKRRPTGYPEVVLSDNPIAYWKADEPSGTIMFDSSGNGHDATYHTGAGGVTLNQTALRLGGIACIKTTANGYASSISTAGLLLSTPYTLEAIVKKTGTGGSVYAAIMGYEQGTGLGEPENPGIVYRYSSTNKQLTAKQSTTESISPNLTSGNIVIVHQVYERAAGLLKVYENGVLVHTTATSNAYSSIGGGTITFLGGIHVPASVGFIGFASDFAVYRTALSAARCLIHAQAAGLA